MIRGLPVFARINHLRVAYCFPEWFQCPVKTDVCERREMVVGQLDYLSPCPRTYCSSDHAQRIIVLISSRSLRHAPPSLISLVRRLRHLEIAIPKTSFIDHLGFFPSPLTLSTINHLAHNIPYDIECKCLETIPKPGTVPPIPRQPEFHSFVLKRPLLLHSFYYD